MFIKNSQFIKVEGPDAVKYLQGQVTQDINLVTQIGPQWSFVLEPNGTMAGFVRIYKKDENSYLLEVKSNNLNSTMERLTKFLIRTKADINLYEDAVAISIFDFKGIRTVAEKLDSIEYGTIKLDLEEIYSQLEEELKPLEVNLPDKVPFAVASTFVTEGICYDTVFFNRSIEVVSDCVLKIKRFEKEQPEIHKQVLKLNSIFRILTLTLEFNSELNTKTVPVEASKLIDRSVNFKKGCYVGQELVERIDARKAVPPHSIKLALFSVSNCNSCNITGSNFVGINLMQSDEVVGTVLSCETLGDNVIAAVRLSRKFDPEKKLCLDLNPIVGSGLSMDPEVEGKVLQPI
jgi:folate-binding protein YgfZ